MNANQRAADKMLQQRAALLITQPFWGVMAMQMRLVERPGIETMAVDGESLFYEPDFVLSLPDAEIRGVLAHEVEHIARLHHVRRGNRDSMLFNVAADYAINPGLLKGGFKLPAGALQEASYADWTAEAIYADLSRNARQVSLGGPSIGQVLDAPGGAAKREEAEMKAETMVRQAAAIAKAQGAGKLPGFVEQLIADLDKPRVDWREVYRRFTDDAIVTETAWTRPNRRFPPPLILPGKTAAGMARLVAGFDCSGSMDEAALKATGGEFQSMLDEGCIARLTAVYFDTQVHRVEEYNAGDVLKFEAVGRGGTDFEPFFDWVERNASDASAAIVLTDMMPSSWNLEDPGMPVLWGATGRYRPEVPFGEVVEIDAHA